MGATLLDALAALLLVGGAAFALIGSWALAKLGTFLKRVHGPTKATTLGLALVLLGSVAWFGARGEVSLHEVLISVFLFVTVPVSSQLLAKAAFKEDSSSRPPPPPS
jgi:multicomponent K+:H+ antiporter subunit G